MNTLKDYVNWKLTHADKTAEAEGYPLTMENCKKNKRMKQLEVYGNSVQDGTPTPEAPIEVQAVGELVTDTSDANYGKYRIPVVVRGINLFSIGKCATSPKTVNGITFTPLSDGRVHIAGKAINPSSVTVSFVAKSPGNMPIKKGIYKIKPSIHTPNGYFKMSIGVSDGVHTLYIDDLNQNTNNIALDGGYVSFIRFQILGDGRFREWDDIIELQLVRSESDLAYEPYVEPVTTNVFLDAPLRKIGDYADYVDFKNKKVVRNIKTLNSEQINKYNIMLYSNASYGYTNSYRFAGGILNTSARDLQLAYCNLLDGGGFFLNAPLTSISYSSGGFLYLRFDDENNYGVTNIATCKQWIKDNNLLIHCVRNTPTEEPIICNLPKLKAKTSIIEVGTSLAASNAKGKYIKK